MKAVQLQRTGGPEVLEYLDLPDPQPKPGEALIQVKAIGVNYTDVYTRTGLAYPAALPTVVGVEAAGIVAAVGEGVTAVKVGDAVGQYGASRSYAEYMTAPISRVVPLPPGVSFELAAAAMLQGMTAQYLAEDCYPLRQGDIALVHAGAGGVGQLLIQFAKARGATVIATVSTDEKAQIARACGADHVVLYSQEDFEPAVMRITNNAGLHVVYDSVGKDTFLKGMTCLRPRGVMVAYGQSSGWPDPVPLQLLNQKSTYVTRPTLVSYTLTHDELAARAGRVFGEIQAGRLKVNVTRTFPLRDAAEAHRLLQGRATTGKLLLIP